MAQELNDATRRLLDTVADGVIVFDRELLVAFANAEAQRYFGSLEGKKLGDFLKSFIILEKGERLEAENFPTVQALRDNKTIQIIGAWERFSAEALTLETTASPYELSPGERGVVLTLRNIAPQLAFDRELREFLSITSHQFRTPLATISWLLEILLAGKLGKLNEEQWDIVHKARQAAIELIDTVQLILDASRIELGVFAISPEPRNIGELLREEVEKMQIFATQKEQTLTLEAPTTLPAVLIDEVAFRFICSNLFSNAVKYTGEKGTITVSLREEADHFCVTIQDNGIGIPHSDQERIFTKFFRAENVLMKSDGTGLGLYVVKQLLERVGGKIWFTSEEGKGATFTFTIPREGFKKASGKAQLEIPARPLY